MSETLPSDHTLPNASSSVFRRPAREYRARPSTKRRSLEARELLRKDAQRRARQRDVNRIPVLPSLESPHPFVARTMLGFNKAEQVKDGLVQPRGRKCIDLQVTPGLVTRTLAICDALVKAVEARGWRFTLSPRTSDRNTVVIGRERFTIFLYEIVESIPHKPTKEELAEQKADRIFFRMPKRDRVPTGRLHLGLTPCYSGRGHWSDNTRWAVEDCLDLLLEALEKSAAAAPDVRKRSEEQRQQAEQARLAQEAEWRQMQEERRQAESRRAENERRAKLLLSDIERMKTTDAVHEYLRRLIDAAQADGVSVSADTSLGAWIAWVKDYADALNPCRADVAAERLAQAEDLLFGSPNAW